MHPLRRFLVRLVLTKDEQLLLHAERRTLLAAMLSPEAWRIVQACEQAHAYQPEPAISTEDAEAWEGALQSPIGLKVDTAMINFLHQQAQRAISAPADDVLAQAKFALGCRAGWEMAKSIPRLAAAHRSQSEQDADTAASALAQHEP